MAIIVGAVSVDVSVSLMAIILWLRFLAHPVQQIQKLK